MASVPLFLFLVVFIIITRSEDDIGEVTENDLALRNARGLPKQLFLNAFTDATKKRGYAMDSELEDIGFLMRARNAALSYISDSMPEDINPGMCNYSWIAWIPFSGCSAPSTKVATYYTVEDTNVCS